MASIPYYYDAQMRRVIIQMMRIFSGFRYLAGVDSTGTRNYATVPVVWGDGDRQAQQMLTGNSENTSLSVPRIAVYIVGLKPAALSRGAYNGNIDNLLIQERAFDINTGQYTNKKGNSYEVDRLQPNPLDIQFKVDIWTSNQDQKFQLFEQIYLLFNPDLTLQTVDSPLDWTAIQTVTLDDITWQDNGADRGTDDTTDVLSMSFTAFSYISPPARVKKQKIIQTIIENIGDSLNDCDGSATWNGQNPIQIVVTPNEAHIQVVNNNQIILLGPNKNLKDINGNLYNWSHLLDDYGQLIANYSRIALRWVSNIEDSSKDIIGYITLDPVHDNILNFNIIQDTLPISTQLPVLAIIDPHAVFPGTGLPAAIDGQRYIVTNTINSPTIAWGNLTCEPNDIIMYSNNNWTVSLSVATNNNLEFVQNAATGQLLKLVNNAWIDAVNQYYNPGYFRIMM